MKTLKRLLLIVLIITSNNIFAQDEGIPCNTGYTSVSAGGGTYASEVSWTISDCDGNLLAEGGVPYEDCLDVPDNAIVNMVDSYGDGWNGNVLTIGDNVFELANGSSGQGFIGACAENETFCDGEWVEETNTYNCSSFSNQSSCENIDGCSWEYSWGGWVSGGSSDCLGGVITNTDSYCDGTMLESIWGCTDESALNYNPEANQDDGSCILCDGEWEEVSTAYNCSSFSNQSSCENIEECTWESWWVVGDSYGGSFSYGCGGGEGTATNIYCDGELVILGCTDSEFLEYNTEANADDGSCDILSVYGCNNPNYIEYNPDVNIYDGSCVTYNVYGCLDSSALNFNTDANIDDGSCTYTEVVAGCTDVDAMNYNSSANIDDGSCSFENNSDCENIYITLNHGWNMIGFACSINTDANIAFGPIQDKIILVKDAVGNAYLPDFDFNGIGELERGYGYLLKVSEEINNYSICE